MFLAEVLTALNTGMKQAFHDTYPVEEFRDLHTSIEFPVDQAEYPAVWVGFEPRGQVRIAGIDHKEFIARSDGPGWHEVTRWTFEGVAVFTVVSMTSLARARLMDEIIAVLGFGPMAERSEWRDWIYDNPLIGMVYNHERIALRGVTESRGTPWGTDELLYEATLAVDVIGEFVSPITEARSLVPLAEIRVFDRAEQVPDPLPNPTVAGPWPWHGPDGVEP